MRRSVAGGEPPSDDCCGELCPSDCAASESEPSESVAAAAAVAALVALAPLTLPIPLPLPLPLPLGSSLIWNGRARPDAYSSAALATISALSASFSARVSLRAGFSTTTSFPFLFSRPISISQNLEHLVSADWVLLRCEKAKAARLRGLLDVWELWL